VADDVDDRKKDFAALIRNNVRPRSSEASKKLSVNGNHNLIVMRGAKIVIASPPEPPAHANGNGKGNGKKKQTTWREELEGLIWQRVWDLGMTSEQFYGLAGRELRRPVFSLAKVSERNLGVLYEMLATMRRPALD
jgi:hypothetical protein